MWATESGEAEGRQGKPVGLHHRVESDVRVESKLQCTVQIPDVLATIEARNGSRRRDCGRGEDGAQGGVACSLTMVRLQQETIVSVEVSVHESVAGLLPLGRANERKATGVSFHTRNSFVAETV